MQRQRLFSLFLLTLTALLLISIRSAQAQSGSSTFTVLHHFHAPGTDPTMPFASLVQGNDGSFYGTTTYGGVNNAGTVYKLTSSGMLTTLHSFGSSSSDGGEPYGTLIQGADGSFYGTTVDGGIGGYGTVFKITSAGVLTTLHSFSGYPSDGEAPYAGLVQGTDGYFYGATYYGGADGSGTVYKISSDGSSFTTLASFNGSNGNGPFAPLIQGSDGNFYGTTAYGGANGVGVAFQITPSGTLTSFYSFTYAHITDGYAPCAPLVQAANGSFYGATTCGGRNGNGTVFTLTPSGKESTLYQFQLTDGMSPYAGLLIGGDGALYGTAPYGGAYGGGSIFKLSLNGVLQTLYSFSGLDETGANPDGAYPYAALVKGTDGDFYSTTLQGGQAGKGVAYQLSPDGSQMNPLYAFGADGANPIISGLVQANDGLLYGTTFNGGASGNGAIYKLSLDGAYSTLYSFLGSTTSLGSNPHSNLIQASDGNFYGTNYFNYGAVFQLKPDGTMTVLHSFSGGDGSQPFAGLVEGSDGYLYGVTANGGLNPWPGGGTVFKVSKSGAFTSLHSFPTVSGSNNTNTGGAYPYSGLIDGKDGYFYGFTEQGGSGGTGTLFRIDANGNLTTLYNFGSQAGDGTYPYGSLVLGQDGYLYGVASKGGTYNLGAIYRFDRSSGQLSTLYSFLGSPVDGVNPLFLIQGQGGSFYGVTQYGGANGEGSVFQYQLGGSTTLLHSFSMLSGSPGVNSDGAEPYGSLLQTSDGNLYGTTWAGGVNGGGTAFCLALNSSGLSISSLSPTFAQAGDPGFTLTVNGIGFTSGATVNWNGTPLSTTFISATELTAQVPDAAIATPGTANVTVSIPNGATSSPAAFTITNPPPDIFALDPGSITEGSPGFTLTVDGDNFVNGSAIYWNFMPVTTSYVSANQLTAAIPAADVASPGDVYVIVVNPDGNVSNAALFSVNTLPPTISGLNPSSAVVGSSDLALTVSGSNFVSGSTVRWNGTPLSTSFNPTSPNQLQATIPAVDMKAAGTAAITVVNPDGSSSSAATFTVTNPVPVIKSLSPSSALAGMPGLTLTVNGSGFMGSSTVNWNGTALPTSYVSSTQLQAMVSSAQLASAGTAAVTVSTPEPGGITSTSNSKSFTIIETTLKLVSATLTRNSTTGVITAQVTLQNTGYLAAQNVTITASKLGTAGTTSSLPVTVGTIAAGGTGAVTLTYPGTAGASGTTATLSVSGKFTGGTFSNLTYKVTLP